MPVAPKGVSIRSTYPLPFLLYIESITQIRDLAIIYRAKAVVNFKI